MIEMDALFALPLAPLVGMLAWKAVTSALDLARAEKPPFASGPKLG